MPLPPIYTSDGANGTNTYPPDNTYTPFEANNQALAYAVAEAETDGQTITLTQLAPGLTPIELELAIPADRPITGMEATQDGTNKLQTNVAGGTFQILGVKATYAGGSVPATNGDATYPRYDIVTINAAGTLAVQPGTPDPMPVRPTIAAGLIALAVLFVPANATSASTDIGFQAYDYSNNAIISGATDCCPPVIQYETGTCNVDTTTELFIGDVTGGSFTATLLNPVGANKRLVVRYRDVTGTFTLTLAAGAGVDFDDDGAKTTLAINNATNTWQMLVVYYDAVRNTWWTGDPL